MKYTVMIDPSGNHPKFGYVDSWCNKMFGPNAVDIYWLDGDLVVEFFAEKDYVFFKLAVGEFHGK